jgi:hypothetical protein
MIKFIPRELAMWVGKFNFPPKMLPLSDFKLFATPKEFVEFLKENKISFEDKNNPCFINIAHEDQRKACVIQWSKVGDVITDTKAEMKILEIYMTKQQKE